MESITITRADFSTELEALARVGFRAFRQTANADGWARYLRDNTAIHAGETYVARRDGAIVGHASHLALTMQLVGTELSVAGVAGVSVLPEARRAGVADAMMRALLDGMRVRNTPLSMLYAFRLGYYARFGYATMAGPEQVRAAPAQFPASPLRAPRPSRRAPGRAARDAPPVRPLAPGPHGPAAPR
jgi:predicted acetyltransferase